MPENSCHVIFRLCMYICLQKLIYGKASQQEPKFKWMVKPMQTKANFKAKTGYRNTVELQWLEHLRDHEN